MSDKMRTHTDGRNTILQQDLTIKENPPGSVLVIHLFMEEQCSMPAKNTMFSAMERKYEDVDCIKGCQCISAAHDNRLYVCRGFYD